MKRQNQVRFCLPGWVEEQWPKIRASNSPIGGSQSHRLAAIGANARAARSSNGRIRSAKSSSNIAATPAPTERVDGPSALS
jgi:hypothetical protein